MAKTALLIVDHGSKRAEANETLEQMVGILTALRPGLMVAHAHMQFAPPDIPTAIERCVQSGATEIVIHPYMLSPGHHATQDIPKIVAQAQGGHPGVTFRITEPLGLDQKIAEVILKRAGLSASRARAESSGR